MKCPKCSYDNPANTRFCGQCGTPLTKESTSMPSSTETYQTPSVSLKVGEMFAGRYHVIEEVGRGGMGTVYKALDTEINEKVALKLLKPEIAADEKTIQRFRNELKVARKISHKNICRMYHLGKEQNTRFITMEFIPGEDLKTTIYRVGALNIGKAIHITKQICEGLVEAHKTGIVHRDLKPQNIMIDKQGNARIMDFGIARSLVSEGITETGVMIGTPEYMSPEQVEGKQIDQRSDIYSLGIILYEMVTGEVPFKGSTPFSVAIKHKSEMPREPRERNYQIPTALNNVILKCMEKNGEERYQSAEELKSVLENLERGLATTELEGVKKKKKRNKEPGKKRLPLWAAAGAVVLVVVLAGGYWLLNRGGDGGGSSESSKPVSAVAKKPEEKESVETGKLQKSPPENKQILSSDISTEKSAPRKPEPKVETRRSESRATRSIPPVVSTTGQLELKSRPSAADVFIDGRNQGKTPLNIELSPGSHQVKISKVPQYSEINESIEVAAGETFAKTYALTPVYILRVTTVPPGAEISIDGSSRGVSPVEVTLDKASCRIRANKGEGWKPHDESLNLKPGINPTRITMEKQAFTVTIRTNPSGARVFIDDSPVGTSPLQSTLDYGGHNIRLEKDGHRIFEETVNVSKNLERTFTLSQLQQVDVRLIVQPFASVFLDGTSIGEVPPIKTIKIMEGKHTMKFVNSRLNKEYTKEFDLKPGASREIRMNMATGDFELK
ncbi:MAG: protein kinase [Candidatus Aminicenantes bacterium]|nr:protein kinase [Candidatus Aminicenantes bacterium]